MRRLCHESHEGREGPQVAPYEGYSLDIQNQATEIKLRAERKAGELLQKMEKARDSNPNLLHGATSSQPTYKKLAIERTQATVGSKSPRCQCASSCQCFVILRCARLKMRWPRSSDAT